MPAKASAKHPSWAIGAPVPPVGKAKSKAKDKRGNSPIGAASTARQDAAAQKEPSITSETALEFLKNAPATQSFADYQQTKQGASTGHESQTAQDEQDAQTAQDEQVARAYQADLNAQAAQDAAATEPAQTANFPDLDEEDDAAMQQALILSRQQDQSQGSDPQAASSAGTTQTTDQELQHELKVGLDYQTEVQTLQMKMSQAPLRPDEVARYRTVSQLWSANQARVAELCDRQVQENIAKQSCSTSAMLGSLRPLNIAKAKGPALKPPPSSKDSTGAYPPPASEKQSGAVASRKAPPPILGSDRPLAVKTRPQGPPAGPPKGPGSGAGSLPIQSAPPAPSSPKGPSQPHLEGKVVSPRGRLPPRVLLDLPILQGHHLSLTCRLQGVLQLKLLLTLKRDCVGKRKRNDLGLMNRIMCNVMIGNSQNSTDLVITSKSIDLAEILDEGIDPQAKIHHLLILRMMTIDHHHQEAPDLEDMSTQGVIGQDPVGARDLNDEEEAHLKRRGGHDQKEERVNIDHPKIEEGGILFITRTRI